MKEIPILREKFISQCPNKNFGSYVWETTMGPQMGYAFSKLHALAYTFIGIQTLYLATNFPQIYWNCACLIVNAGGAQLFEADSNEDISNKNVNYGKISTALGKIIQKNIKIMPPDINKADFIFKPDENNNAILYGLKGITQIGTPLIYDIINNRPYSSIEDFLNKIKISKSQMFSLLKAGCFDNYYKDRYEAIQEYLNLIVDKKEKLTLSNLNALINNHLIPKDYLLEVQIYQFNKYIKKNCKDNYYCLDNISTDFFIEHFDSDLLEEACISNKSHSKISKKTWDKIYKEKMLPIKEWITNNQKSLLESLNKIAYEEIKNKYANGDINKWDMESLGTYCHQHELHNINILKYGISDFDNLDEEPTIATEFTTKDHSIIRLYNIHRICGTIVDKDKNKNTIYLLTPSMTVVPIKVWKNQYAKWDKQISKINSDGSKTVIEKSFFERGNRLIVTGIRRGDSFIPKKYKGTEFPLFEKINILSDDGDILDSSTERADTIEEE